MKQKNRKLNKSLNGVESSNLLQQSISSSQMLNPVGLSVNFGNGFPSQMKNQNYIYGVDCI
jgi:hypothetical protein